MVTETDGVDNKVSIASVLLPKGGLATKTAAFSLGVFGGITNPINNKNTQTTAKISRLLISSNKNDISDYIGAFAI